MAISHRDSDDEKDSDDDESANRGYSGDGRGERCGTLSVTAVRGNDGEGDSVGAYVSMGWARGRNKAARGRWRQM